MEKITLVKEIYREAFKDWKSIILEHYFKVFSWCCLVLIGTAVYALIFRISTGFSFGNF
ncbi:DUF6747 family protein [Maribacter ulvicola]|uniref:Uncharacterized protein n=1 Tax=Maribacter ulvicola TaxID=228959 RepID=A0A1N6PI80_9FLAO|nr:DUF6747 family protein [Maribacter ulvicola]SIQ03987.1 hypothetical protein SAMN05421797_101458 [Maribacter ulvicola]